MEENWRRFFEEIYASTRNIRKGAIYGTRGTYIESIKTMEKLHTIGTDVKGIKADLKIFDERLTQIEGNIEEWIRQYKNYRRK